MQRIHLKLRTYWQRSIPRILLPRLLLHPLLLRATVHVKGDVEAVDLVALADADVGGVMVDEAMEMIPVKDTTVLNGGISHKTNGYWGKVHTKMNSACPMQKNCSRVLIIVPFVILQRETTLERGHLTMDQRWNGPVSVDSRVTICVLATLSSILRW